MRAVADSGRHLVLVTGRTREELLDVFSELELFDAIVIENGAVLLDPVTGNMQPLAHTVSHELVALLHRKGIDILLQAYLRAFSASDDVVLVIKDTGTRTVYQRQNERERILALARDVTRPRTLSVEASRTSAW